MEKEILGYENYTIDEDGNVFTKKRGRYMRPFANHSGYLGIYLSKNGKRKYFFIHKLVAVAFVPNPNNYKEVNHIDEDKKNNKAENLEWCTREYNNNYGTKLSKVSKRVKCIETGVVYPSFRAASRETGISAPAICWVCNGKRKTAGGYTWEHVNGVNACKH